jgi:prepilin-type N-terminal cleavage/methylation domain-containing protein
MNRPVAQRAFTLIELLAVIAIMAIMLAIGTVALNSLNKATGVSAGTRGVMTALETARQNALTQRTYARVVFPYRGTTGAEIEGVLYYISYAVMVSNVLWEAPLTAWSYAPGYENFSYLPAGSVFASGSNTVGALDLLPNQLMTWRGFQDSNFTFTNTFGNLVTNTYVNMETVTERFAFIEFTPRGVSSRTLTVAVAQGSTAGWSGGGGATSPGTTSVVHGVNRAWLIVERGSGRIRVERP